MSKFKEGEVVIVLVCEKQDFEVGAKIHKISVVKEAGNISTYDTDDYIYAANDYSNLAESQILHLSEYNLVESKLSSAVHTMVNEMELPAIIRILAIEQFEKNLPKIIDKIRETVIHRVFHDSNQGVLICH